MDGRNRTRTIWVIYVCCPSGFYGFVGWSCLFTWWWIHWM